MKLDDAQASTAIVPDATPTHRSIRLADGRSMEVLLGGDPLGYPLVAHHGTPGEMNVFADWHLPCRARGLRLICASRPGYANSTRKPGRSVSDVAADVAALLHLLGHDRFLTVGWSGGGPHALACAALLPDRCVAVATLGGVAAYAEGGLDFLAGMGAENVAEFGAAAAGETELHRWMADHADAYRAITGVALADALGGLVPDVDRDALTGELADRMAAAIRRATSRGFDGWIDDDLGFVRPWGFHIDAIRSPVTVWQGELDLMVPLAHGRWLLQSIPGAAARILPGQGHISLVANFKPQVLDDLLSSVTRSAA